MKGLMKKWLLPIAGVLILALLFNRFLFFQIVVRSGSMEPTILAGDHIIVLREYSPEDLQTGDVVVFQRWPEGKRVLVIKRLIGTPGDHVVFEDGLITLNGERLEENYIEFCDCYTGEFYVPEDQYFFCGDCRSNSMDSRHNSMGYIDGSDILAKAGLRIWPLARFGLIR